MKNSLFIATVFVGILITSCSNEPKQEKESTPQAQSETKDSNPTVADQQTPKAIHPDELDPNMEVVEVVDEKGNIVQVVKDPETGEEVVVTTDTDILEASEKVESGTSGNESNVDEPTPDFNIHEYTKLDAFLKTYVTGSGQVKYASIKSNKSELDEIIAEFNATSAESSWSKNQKLAFWINAYNIFTIKLIVDNYPTSSITKITAKPWDKKFANIGGKTYTLNNIETDIIRKKYNEPRIHFALNCASESCPVLLNKAYTSSNLNSLLTSQTKRFLNDTSKNTFSKKEAQISKIFDWYAEDFGDSVMDFIKEYHTLDYTPKKTTFMEYSWNLNK